MSIGDEMREAHERLLEFVNTATAEEGWCYMCGDLAADIEAPALTRLRAEVLAARAERDQLAERVRALADDLWGDPNEPHDSSKIAQTIFRHISGQVRDLLKDPRPCNGNANVCAAEGCFGEACIREAVTE